MKEVIVDTFDDSLNQDTWSIVQNWRLLSAMALTTFALLAGIFGRDSGVGDFLMWMGFVSVAALSGVYIWRSRIVRRRVEKTGLPFAEREPY